MKVLLVGEVTGNTGPSNVHKSLVEYWPSCDSIQPLYSKNKIAKLFEAIFKGLKSDVIISCGAGWTDIIAHRLLSVFGKPVICFNHGYVPFENEINGLGYSDRTVKAIIEHLRTADLIVANSSLQENFVKKQLPECSDRVKHVCLGVKRFKQCCFDDQRENIIAVSGGTRPIKANEMVAKAVSILRDRGVDCSFRVYGRRYSDNASLDDLMVLANGEYRGQVASDQFVNELRECSVFVMNSRHEPFGLSALDAIEAGCSLLLSANCGIAEVMSIQESDVVNNCEDPIEVADKIEGLLQAPNSKRLFDSIDFDECSWAKTAETLRNYCAEVLG